MKLIFLLSLLYGVPWARGADATPAFILSVNHYLIGSRIDGEAVVQFAPPSERARGFTLTSTCLREGDLFDTQTIRFEGEQPVRGWRSIVDGYYVSYQQPPRGKTALSGYFAADGARFTGAALPGGLAPFEGFFAGDNLSLSEVKKTALHIALSESVVDGALCQGVTFDAPDFGHYHIAYDAASGYLPRAAEVRKKGRDYLGQQRLNDGPPRTPLGSASPTPIVEFEYLLDQVKFDQVKGAWYPRSCRMRRILRYGDGNTETTTMLWRRTSLSLDPTPPAEAFRPEMRQGAHLANLSEPQLSMQWKDGGAVPLVDPALVTQMNTTADALRRERGMHTPGPR